MIVPTLSDLEAVHDLRITIRLAIDADPRLRDRSGTGEPNVRGVTGKALQSAGSPVPSIRESA